MEGMGFGVGAAQCLVAPPYVFAGMVMYSTAWFGDKYHVRAPVLIFNALLCIIGLPMMGFAKGDATRYAGVFFTVAGANANIPSCMAYQANNVRGQSTSVLECDPRWIWWFGRYRQQSGVPYSGRARVSAGNVRRARVSVFHSQDRLCAYREGLIASSLGGVVFAHFVLC